MNMYRVHGDNIVECERIIKLIVDEVNPYSLQYDVIAPSTLQINIKFHYLGVSYDWGFELLPGFNKYNRIRWPKNIFDILKSNGSFLDETPDAIITSVCNNIETVLCAIEFCSALQAGNQAWQRSGRAFSIGRTGCHYLYIVDFVKYELDPITRERMDLRYPNAAVPYSYISFSRLSNNFVAQVYVRSEEFDKKRDTSLESFDEDNFGEKDLAAYLIKRLAGLDTSNEQYSILKKNFNVVQFLSEKSNKLSSLSPTQWKEINSYEGNIVDYSTNNVKFNFHKTIAAKSQHGKSSAFLELVDTFSIGLASRDFPAGIIPASARKNFCRELSRIYPNIDKAVLKSIACKEDNLILCIIKGFKPRGDDNRPDRGILPLVAMLSSINSEIMTFIYGPVLSRNFNLLLKNPLSLAETNGLWKAILGLSNYLLLDVPILNGDYSDAEVLLDTSSLKSQITELVSTSHLSQNSFPAVPNSYHEDDVDTGIHYTFSCLFRDQTFECLCNPPGGDWSGISIIDKGIEKRWLSLPRVSEEIDGKRPDHIIELFNIFDKPLLLSIESKEKSSDLETDVGTSLINYIKHLMNYVPNVEMDKSLRWKQSKSIVKFNDYKALSAAAYLKKDAQDHSAVFNNTNCDMLFVMTPEQDGWVIELIFKDKSCRIIKEKLKSELSKKPNSKIHIK